MPETKKRARKSVAATGGAAFAKSKGLLQVVVMLSPEEKASVRKAAGGKLQPMTTFIREAAIAAAEKELARK